MSAQAKRGRGQPLVVLIALLLGWTGARVSNWTSGGELNLPAAVLTVETAAAKSDSRATLPQQGPQSYAPFAEGYAPAYAGEQGRYALPTMSLRGGSRFATIYVPVYVERPAGAALTPAAGGHSFSHLLGEFPRERLVSSVGEADALPSGLVPLQAADARPATPRGVPLLAGPLGRLLGNRKHWSADAWALIRDDSTAAPAPGTLPASYGASQAGAVLRYRFALENPHRPTAYLRTTSTLGMTQETAVALGLSLRPLASIPVTGAIEGRLTRGIGGQRVQPAVMGVTELPPLTLPFALRAEAYAQAGYVGGRYATPFADGQVRVDRAVLDVGRYQARLGGGAWGGIQKGASRLDAGPGAVVAVPLGRDAFGRIAVDWRFRVAGNAEPGSGPTLTLATGF